MNTLKSMVIVVLITFCFLSVIVMAQEKTMVAHWKLDETTGLTASDELGSSDGTLMNMDGTEWVPGVVGNALDFTLNLAPYVMVPDNDIIEHMVAGAVQQGDTVKNELIMFAAEQEAINSHIEVLEEDNY